MIYIYILLAISTILDILLSGITHNTVLIPLFSVTSMIIIYPLMKNNKSYLKLILIYGIISGFFFSPFLLFNTLIYLIIALFIIELNNVFKDNIGHLILMTILVILFYRILIYINLIIIKAIDADLSILFKSIYSSLILNLIYIIIINFISNKFKL